jgi:hypothetical protein
VFILLAASTAGDVGCQDGYPIAATPCDEWCEQTRRLSCYSEDPAACVASCEKSGLTRGACADLTNATIKCLQEKPDQTVDCEQPSGPLAACLSDQEAALECASMMFPRYPGPGGG